MPIAECPVAHPAPYRSHQAVRREPFRWRPVARAIFIAVHGMALLQVVLPQPAWAQAPAAQPVRAAAQRFDIPAGALAPALRSLAGTANLLLTFTEEQTAGKATAGLRGEYTPESALELLLAGTGLQAVALDNGAYVLRAAPAAASVTGAGETVLPVVTVREQAERTAGLPAAYAGGQVARGGRLGILGNTDLMDAPFNISSYTAELIENQQARTVAAVLANDPSVRDAATASAPGQYLLIRGFASLEASIFFNGLPGMAPNNRSSTDMAERVEVLKGPSAALSGMVPDGSVGGTVMIVPKRAADEPLTRIGVEYANASQLGTRVDVGRRFGENNAWGLRVNGVLHGGESYIDGRDQRAGLASIALDYRGERLRAALDAYDQKDKRDGADYYVHFAGQPSAVPDASKPMTRGDSTNARDRMAMIRLEYDLTPSATVFAALGKHRYRSRWVYANVWDVDAQGHGVAYAGSYRYNADLHAAEAGLRVQANTGPVSHRITLAGTDFKRSGYYGDLDGGSFATNIFDPVAATDPGDPGRPPKTEGSRLKSVALTDTLGLWDERLLLTLGLRHQQVATESIWSDPYDESATSPTVAVVFKPSPSVSLYANYIQGLSEGPVAPVGMEPELDNAGEVFPPYKTQQYELGVKGEWNGFGSSLSLFQIARPNSLTVDNRFTVDGEQRNRGLEWNVYGTLGRGVRVLGGVTLIDAKVTKADGPTQGKKAYGVPGTQVNLGGEWDVPGLTGLTLSGRVLYTDSVYIDDANLYSIPSWTRWDVGARYATRVAGKPLVLRANVDNLFDKSYWMGYRQGWRSGMVSRSAPRTVLLSATVDF